MRETERNFLVHIHLFIFILKYFLENPYEGKVYKFQQGKKIEQILGVKKGAKDGTVLALVRYDDIDYELMPTSILVEGNAAAKVTKIYYFLIK